MKIKILDKLRTIFKGKSGDILSNNKFVLFDFSKNSKDVIEQKDEKTLRIDLSKSSDDQRKLIKKEIFDGVIEKDKDVFLVNESSKRTRQIKKNLPKGNDEKLLKFYKDKLNPYMYKALEASLVVRNSFKNKEDITELKRGIAKKYPIWGNNICNLTGEGYFEGHFKELYHSMLEDDEFSIRTYQRKVENIVTSLPYSVFITKYKDYDELSGEVKFKLDKLKKYGTAKLLLHGLGKDNVNTCLEILSEYEDDKSISIKKDINRKKTIITATLTF